jgi:hypothetical protein
VTHQQQRAALEPAQQKQQKQPNIARSLSHTLTTNHMLHMLNHAPPQCCGLHAAARTHALRYRGRVRRLMTAHVGCCMYGFRCAIVAYLMLQFGSQLWLTTAAVTG